MSYVLGKTYTHLLANISFDNLPADMLKAVFKDGRVFSHLIEAWVAQEYNITHIKGCRGHDFVCGDNGIIKIDQKSFTGGGLSFTPSNMKGQGRIFDRNVFEKKTKDLQFCCVSNINFPEIKIKFIDGVELLQLYPNGRIPLHDHDKFFN